MGTWSPALFADDMALDIRREYSFLLSIGKDNKDIEDALQEYYASILNCNDPDEDIFWFILAYCEWKKGRLSSFVKEKAVSALDSGRDLERWNTSESSDFKKRKKVLNDLREMLLSPMPPAKKAKKPTVRHCPWPVGSLLAYRIVSFKELANHPCFKKYVLLRIVKINRRPITKLFPTEYYNESMIVGLYNWIGSEIPDPSIVEQLEFIPIKEYNPHKPVDTESIIEAVPDEAKSIVSSALVNLFSQRTIYCMILNWKPGRGEICDITYLGCDESFKDHIPDFLDTSIYSTPLTGFTAFDINLSKNERLSL